MNVQKRTRRTVTICHDGKTHTYAQAGRGFEYLEELLAHPKRPIYCGELRQLFQIDPYQTAQADFEDVNVCSHQSCHNFPFLPIETPIETADEQTIKQVKQRLLELINEEAELMQYHDLARLEDVRDEKDALVRYLKQALTPMQKPRYLHHQQRNDYSAVKKAIQRAIAKLQPTFPSLANDLKQNLDFGLQVCYKKVV